MKVMYYKVDGTIKDITPADGKTFSLKELYALVGEPVQFVPLPDGREFIVNEEGKLTGLLPNTNATEIWKQVYPIAQYPENNDELIVGEALLVTDYNDENE